MPQAASVKSSRDTGSTKQPLAVRRIADALTIAREQGLLSGGRTLTVRGRMPSLLVEKAKKKTGIHSDSKLIEAALANIVAADDYGEWLLSQRGSVGREVDLEF